MTSKITTSSVEAVTYSNLLQMIILLHCSRKPSNLYPIVSEGKSIYSFDVRQLLRSLTIVLLITHLRSGCDPRCTARFGAPLPSDLRFFLLFKYLLRRVIVPTKQSLSFRHVRYSRECNSVCVCAFYWSGVDKFEERKIDRGSCIVCWNTSCLLLMEEYGTETENYPSEH